MCGGTSETVLAEEERSPGPALGDCWEGGPESQARGGGNWSSSVRKIPGY